MSHSSDTDKFFLFKKSPYASKKMLLGINPSYTGDIADITLEDLLNFLKEKNINPSRISLPGNFITHVSRT